MKDKFEKLKSNLESKNNDLAEAKGKLNALLQSAKEEFGTDDLDKLKEIEEDYAQQKDKLENDKEELEEKIEELLSEIESE